MTEGNATSSRSSGPRPNDNLGSRRAPLGALLGVVALLLVSSFVVVGASSGHATALPASRGPALSAHPSIAPLAPPSSGKGLFFSTHGLPLVPTGNRSCWAPYFGRTGCNNASVDPSIDFTSKGLLAVAYTALTNISECGNATGNASVEIGFSASSNNGTTWSAPKYLGNPDCSQALNYPNSDQPSLTSLANGTLVLAYIQYSNVTSSGFPYYGSNPPALFSWELRYDRLVVRESYNNGTTWTAPAVLNSSFDPNAGGNPFGAPRNFGAPPSRPWATAIGNTVYVGYENTTDNVGFLSGGNYYSSSVFVTVSLNGGTSWSAPTQLTSVTGNFFGTLTNYAANPYVLTAPNGTLFVGYATNISYNFAYCSPFPPKTCVGTFVHDLELATSTNNGSTFSYSTIASSIPDPNDYTRPFGAFSDPSPALAFDPTRHDLVAAWSGGLVGSYCFAPTACFGGQQGDLFVANSNPNGTTFSAARLVDPGLLNANGGVESAAFLPALAVDAAGVVHLETTVLNQSMCYASALPFPSCTVSEEVYYNSTDGGMTFSAGVNVWAGVTPSSYWYTGEYATIATHGPHLWLAWSGAVCPVWNASPFGGFCNYGYGTPGYSQIEISQPFTGAGVTVSFTATGLPSSVTWTASLMGNLRSFTGNGTITVSGVPTGVPLYWSVPWVNTTYHTAEAAVVSPLPIREFTGPTTISITFSLAYGIDVETNPVYSSIAFNCSNCGVNYGLTPSAGLHWGLAGSYEGLSAYPHPMYCFGYCFYDNLSFLSWVGTGPGSVTTNASSTSATLNGPINETAVFNDLGYCVQTVTGTPVVCVRWAYNVTFQESGLPAGTMWAVTANNTTLSTRGTSISSPSTAGLTYFTVWDVPSATSGMVWVPTTNFPSPVGGAIQGTVDVTYSLQSAASATFAAYVNTTGLPNGTSWSAAVGGQWRGTNGSSLSFNVSGGVSFPLNTTPIELENGTGYSVASITAQAFEVNQTAATFGGSNLSWTPSGPVEFTLHYRPMYRLTTAATPGGSASPVSEWVVAGGSAVLTATASAGHSFVGWSGSGPGSTTVAQATMPTVTITPRGPVSELATFRLTPAPTWNVTVVTRGLDNGSVGGVTLNGTTYSGNGTFEIPLVSTGPYAISAPFVASASSPATRFVPGPVAATFARVAPGTWEINGNGTIWLNYTTQFSVTVTALPHGSVSPSAGVSWLNQGASASFTATPQAGYRFDAWNGTGAGAVFGTTPTLSWTVTGPAWETASFVPYIATHPTYSLAVTESGLPAGTTWSVGVGATGASGAGTSVSVGGLNGSYAVSVPTVYVSDAVRWVPSSTGAIQVNVTKNATYNVSFLEQFDVAVVAGAGGTVTAASGWVAANTTLTLSATPSAGYRFVNWTGTGPGAYSGAAPSTTFLVTGPVTESANFASTTSGSSTSGATSTGTLTAVLVIAGLTAVGLVAGWALGRMRRSRTPPPGEEPASEESSPTMTDWSEEGSGEMGPPPG